MDSRRHALAGLLLAIPAAVAWVSGAVFVVQTEAAAFAPVQGRIALATAFDVAVIVLGVSVLYAAFRAGTHVIDNRASPTVGS